MPYGRPVKNSRIRKLEAVRGGVPCLKCRYVDGGNVLIC